MTRKVLLVDDNKNVLTMLTDFLSTQDFDVVTASNGYEALDRVKESNPDIILLDIMMPDLDGYQFINRLRRESIIPVIMITAKRQEADLIRGFDLGADDYITKPFRMRELLVRIRAVLRRAAHSNSQDIELSAGGLVLDRNKHEVHVQGKLVDITPLEFQLLEILMEASGQVVRRADLCTRLIEHGYTGSEATLKIHIRNLRTKIELDPEKPIYIETVFGVGYRLGDQT